MKQNNDEPLELANIRAFVPRPPIVGFVPRSDSEGRDIIVRLREELAPQKNQLIALWGPGGVGKTTLAAEAARALSEDFAHRIVWTGALGREDFALSTLLDEIATQLGQPDLRPLAPEPKAEQVQALIASAPTLIILDNVEVIRPDEQLRCLDWIARNAPCPALITTRSRVGLARNIAIDSMSPAEASELLRRLISQMADPTALAKLDPDHIIQTAEGNPLILQWVVGQIDLAQDPHRVLDTLMRAEGDAVGRVFDRSFNLPQLGEEGRAILLAASLFVPSATRDALSEVAGLSNNPELFGLAKERLLDLQLIATTDDERSYVERILTHELVKARLTTDDRSDIFRQRFIAYFLRFAEVHSDVTPEHLNALEVEKDNILSAMDIAFQLKDWQSVIRIMHAIAFPGLLDIHGYWDEAISRGEQAVKAAKAAEKELTLTVAQLVGSVATIRKDRGEYEQARITHQQNVAAFKSLGSQANVAVSLHQLGMIAKDQGDMEEARRLYNESLEIGKTIGDDSGIARSLHSLGLLAQEQGDLAEAWRLYDESLEIKKHLGDQSEIAITMNNLASIAQLQGEFEKARLLYEESLEITRKLGYQRGIASTLHQLAILTQAQGHLEEARSLYDQSLEISQRLGNQMAAATTLHQLGNLMEEEGRFVKAAELFGQALAILEKLKSPNANVARRSLERVKGKSSRNE
jgi:tetratricopeptide (TPR) repeat protein